jgi:hypothetical protein
MVMEAEKYLLEVSRYLNLNPVRGKWCWARERQWSSGNVCESTAGAATGGYAVLEKRKSFLDSETTERLKGVAASSGTRE